MTSKSLRLNSLLLDLENPRITRATSQREALQRIIEDQDIRLAVLAKSIIDDGLNPMDRWLVLRANEKGKFIVYEGNRRLAAIKLLNNPAVLGDLEVRSAVKKRFEALAKEFDINELGPIDCFEIASREEGAGWLHQRHTGANKGRGIVDWSGVATARFRGSDPALQALDAVLRFGNLDENEKNSIEDWFPITTLDRLLSTPAVRSMLGFEIKQSKLLTNLPPSEAIRPLRRIVRDLANEVINVTNIKSKEQQVEYISKDIDEDLPDLSRRLPAYTPVESWDGKDFGEEQVDSDPGEEASGEGDKPQKPGKPSVTRPKPPKARKTLITRECKLNILNPKIRNIEKELRTLSLKDHPHAIAVLLRVFLENSVDDYLHRMGESTTVSTPVGPKEKKLKEKIPMTVNILVRGGVPIKHLDGVTKGINDQNNPLCVDTLHNYVHNRYYEPKERDLVVAFDNARPFFEAIWS